MQRHALHGAGGLGEANRSGNKAVMLMFVPTRPNLRRSRVKCSARNQRTSAAVGLNILDVADLVIREARRFDGDVAIAGWIEVAWSSMVT